MTPISSFSLCCRLPGGRRMRRLAAVTGLGALTVIGNPVVQGAPTSVDPFVEIYTISELPIRVPAAWQDRTTVVMLDDIVTSEILLAQGLASVNQNRRLVIASERLHPELQAKLVIAWRALHKFAPFHSNRLTHIPAIVLNGEAVYYGRDLNRALYRYHTWQARQ